MARKPREEWKENYRRRVERAEAKYGAAFENDQIALRQYARGHRRNEHRIRRERAIARGDTPVSSADYKFLKRQRERVAGTNPAAIWPYEKGKIVGRRADGTPIIKVETNAERFERARKKYLSLTEDERREVRDRQHRMESRYKAAARQRNRTPRRLRRERDLEEDQYEDDEFYDVVEEMSDDIVPIYFYH